MRTKPTRVGILVAVLGLLGAPMSPAQATTTALAAFTGFAFVPGGLGYPCTENPPFGTPQKPCPPTVPSSKEEGNTSAFTFESLVCTGDKSDINKPGKGTGAYGPLCLIDANGTLTGYCGLSLGTGTGIIAWAGPFSSKTVGFAFKFTGLGGVLLVEGATGKGTITAVMFAIAHPSTGSCTNKTATVFILLGSAAITNTTT